MKTNTCILKICKLFLLCIFMNTIYSQCDDGCLKCDSINENTNYCVVCDAQNGYVSFGNGLCTKLQIENCEVGTTDRSTSKCFLCKPGYIFENISGTCKEINFKIKNCYRYDQNAHCTICETNFFLENNGCVAVETPISNCLIHVKNENKIICQTCLDGYYLNPSSNICEEIPNLENCLGYSKLKCLQCSEKMVMNPNYVFSQPFDKTFLQQLVKASSFSQKSNTPIEIQPLINSCQPTKLKNCLAYENFLKCSKCVPNYFLNSEFKCQRFPEDPILNCQHYLNGTTCLSCVNGTYMAALNDCQSNTIVNFCQNYSKTTDECDQCESGYYLTTPRICTARSLSFNSDQCKTLNKTEDECQICNPGFELNKDKSSCIPGIPYCDDFTVDNNDIITCNSCITGYGFDSENVCVMKIDDNCTSFVTNSAYCDICDNDYYLNSSTQLCEPNTVKHCTIKSKSVNACITCNAKFYVDINDGSCKFQRVTNCLSYTDNTNICTSCQYGTYLDNGICLHVTAKHCHIPSSTANECATCYKGYYPNRDHVDKCAPQVLDNCIEFTENTVTCTKCEYPGYYLDTQNGVCIAHSDENCSVFALDQFHCVSCKENYYADMNNLTPGTSNCVSQAIPNCSKHKPNLNECERCENLYFLENSDTQCSKITAEVSIASSCLKNETNLDECEICHPNYTRISATSCTLSTKVPSRRDPTCVGNTHSIDDGVCNKCEENKLAFVVSEYEGSIPNCIKYNNSDGSCQKCALDYFGDGDGGICNVLKSDEVKCRQKIDNFAWTSQENPENCEVCVEGYYPNPESPYNCLSKSQSVVDNCYTDHLTFDDTCPVCKEGKTFISYLSEFLVCVPTLSSPIEFCHVYDYDNPNECKVCFEGRKNSDCLNNVVDNYEIMYNFVDDNLKIYDDISVPVSEKIDNCKKHFISTESSILCAECEDGYVLVQDFDKNLNGFIFGVTSSLSKIPFIDNSYLKANVCRNIATDLIPIKSDINYSNGFEGDLNDVSYFSYSSGMYYSRGCKNTKNEVYALVSSKIILKNCIENSDYLNMNKNLNGLFLSSLDLKIQIFLNNYFRACNDPSKKFVILHYLNTQSTPFYPYRMIPNQGIQFCVDPSVLNSQDNYDENCQIYAQILNLNFVFNYPSNVSNLVLTCGSCKPGYEYVNSSYKLGNISCKPIDNCDTTNLDKNTWMNACQTCNTGFTWTATTSDGQINFNYHKCIDSTNVPNCKFLDNENLSECIICNPGYTLDSSNLCVQLNILNCDEYNFGFVIKSQMELTQANKIINPVGLYNFRVMAEYFGYFDNKPIRGIGCSKCKPGYSLAYLSSDIEGCFEGANTLISNCKMYKATSPSECFECDEGYIVNSSNGLMNCDVKSVDGSQDFCRKFDGTDCESCLNNYPVDNNKLCHEYYKCEYVNPTTFKCDMCQEGFKHKDDFECEFLNQDDDCMQTHITRGCILCRDSTKSPINYKDANGIFSYQCVTKFNDGNAPNSPLNLKMSNVVYMIDTTQSTIDTQFYTDKSNSFKYGFTSFQNDSSSVYYSVCLESPSTNACETYDEFYQCAQCGPGYVLDPKSKKCLPGPVANCLNYDNNNTTCNECLTQFFIKNNTCQLRSKSTCREYSKTADACISCYPQHYLDEKSSDCIAHSVEFCKDFNETANHCDSCYEKQRYLTVDNVCLLYSKKYCLTYEDERDQCKSCQEKIRYLSSITFECEKYTVKYCDNYNPNFDECIDCLPNYFLNEKKNCQPPSAEHCLKRNLAQDMCDSCVPGYYLVTGTPNKCVRVSALNCSTYSNTVNECDTCLSAHYKDASDSNKCKPYMAKFCDSYIPGVDKCDTCMQGYYKKGDICEYNSSVQCSDLSIESNTCITCNPQFYLNPETNTCMKVTNFTCEKILSNTNTCSLCSFEKYLDVANSGECVNRTLIKNCSEYHTESDLCKKCQYGYYKSSNEEECIPNPNGVSNCVNYMNETTCIQCSTLTYLNGNICEPLTSDPVPDCLVHSGNGICQECIHGKVLDVHTCIDYNVTGCLTYQDKDNCASCLPNQLLDGSPKTCVNTEISDCMITSGTVGNEICLKCSSGSYLTTENTCVASSILIPDCVEYSGDGVCLICASNLAVAVDAKSCIPLDDKIFGQGCTSGTFNSTPSCTFCDNGFMLDSENKCTVSCESLNCQVCDPFNISKCRLCNSGYHMTSDLVCKPNSFSNHVTSVSLFKSMISFILISAMILWH